MDTDVLYQVVFLVIVNQNQLNKSIFATYGKLINIFSFANYLTPIEHCPLTDDCYFSTLYYFETRIINPQLTRDQVLSLLSNIDIVEFTQYKNKLLISGNVMRQSLLDIPFQPPIETSIPSETPKGIIMCHGHIHGTKKLPVWLPQNINWTLVDINSKYNPDIIASYKSFGDLQTLGLFSWDYILNQHCPAYGSIRNINEFLRAGRWLLRSGGQLLFPLLPSSLSRKFIEPNYLNETIQNFALNNYYSNYIINLNNDYVVFIV